jgi:GrpB-like predicted nucleotidyltransferase (UPF0157 family)
MSDYYPYKPWTPIFYELFEKEKQRLHTFLLQEAQIEHIGSTAIPDVSGKGYIDIYIAVPRSKMSTVSESIQGLGYEFKQNAGVPGERLFHQADLPDPLQKTRRYHVHLTHPENADFQNNLKFRDYLRKNPVEAKRYSDIKIKACEEVNKMPTKEDAKEVYMRFKSGIIADIYAQFVNSH